jgi:hypothetical protein
VLVPRLMVRVPWDFPFNVGNCAASQYRPGAPMKMVKRSGQGW